MTMTINPAAMPKIGEVSPRYQSYNVEMVEIVGGTFWKPYKSMPHDADGKPIINIPKQEQHDVSVRNDALYQKLPEADLANPRLRALAAALAPAYMRVSGTWANAVYFHDGDTPLNQAPQGFANVLTAKQWQGVLDFAQAVDAEIVTSFAVSDGVRDDKGVWTPVEAQKILAYTQTHGGKIAAAELFNEPNIPGAGGCIRAGYNGQNFADNQRVFHDWARQHAPDMLLLGPGAVSAHTLVELQDMSPDALSVSELMSGSPAPQFDAYSYHYYNAISCRISSDTDLGMSPEAAMTPERLTQTDQIFAAHTALRDRYLPAAPIWNTETGQAGGGDPYAATYRDTFRYLYQLAGNARHGLHVHMHNTLCASEYSLIEQDSLTPKPDYWAAWLWNKLMGSSVLDSGTQPEQSGVYLFAHNSKQHSDGVCVLLINSSNQPVSVNLPQNAMQYTLTSDGLDSADVYLNGQRLFVGADNILPELNGLVVEAGEIDVPAYSLTFWVFGR
ncbi:hypothetical protein [Neisseria perflava]|uniref:hypothetical protein n=1 Tax=Neisseria perflava TaxID=33053 RepID=UPI0020A0FD30|nr:hypothetical protein [Neisseria perflava]MCP1661045.1 hypothetical protein [Neisseria perflava]MCP1773460.1 hypothetical protein [Neisseria perflava]